MFRGTPLALRTVVGEVAWHSRNFRCLSYTWLKPGGEKERCSSSPVSFHTFGVATRFPNTQGGDPRTPDVGHWGPVSVLCQTVRRGDRRTPRGLSAHPYLSQTVLWRICRVQAARWRPRPCASTVLLTFLAPTAMPRLRRWPTQAAGASLASPRLDC